jgi:WD40 repeat protein
VWDIRDPSKHVIKFSFDEEAYSVSVSLQSLLAVGSGTSIFFRDTRKAQASPLGEYSDLHTDLVTSVKFNREKPSILCSGGEDGICSVVDTSATSGSDAVVSILNVDCAIRKLGYFGPGSEGVYSLTNTETASFWHYPSAQRVGNFPTLREDKGVDYFVDCCSSISDSPLLVAGRYTGEGGLYSVEPEGVECLATFQGHTDVIRTCVLNSKLGRLVTGGEDGCICLWDVAAIHSGGERAANKTKKRRIDK